MFTEDLSVFFNVADMATACTLNGAAVQAIFDNGYAQGQVGLAGMASAQPSLMLPTASVPASPVSMAAVVGGVTYTVVAHEPDGTGVSTLLLERTS